MSTYTEQFRIKASKAYLEGNLGLRRVAKLFDVDVSLLRRWVASYQLHGTTSLRRRGQQYHPDFKRKVVEYKHKHHLSLRQTAAHFGLGSSSQVGIWARQYYSNDIETPPSTRKRKPAAMIKPPKPAVPEARNDNLKSREQLMAELEHLRMENAYLKELEALQEQKRRRQQKKH